MPGLGARRIEGGAKHARDADATDRTSSKHPAGSAHRRAPAREALVASASACAARAAMLGNPHPSGHRRAQPTG